MGEKWSEDLTKTINEYTADANPENELHINEMAIATYLVYINRNNFDEKAKDECWKYVASLLIGLKKPENSSTYHFLSEEDFNELRKLYNKIGEPFE